MSVKHVPNNWCVILSALASNGPMPSTPLRQQLCLLRRGSYHPRNDRGTYIWYFLTKYHQWGGMSDKGGLDYGYMERLPKDENGVALYEITEAGHEYLKANYSKPGYGCSWRRRWDR